MSNNGKVVVAEKAWTNRCYVNYYTPLIATLIPLFFSRVRLHWFLFEADYCALMLLSMHNYGNRERINFSNMLTNSSVSVQSCDTSSNENVFQS